MAKRAVTRSEVLEEEYTSGGTLLIRAVVILVLGGILVWLGRRIGIYPVELLGLLCMAGAVFTAGMGVLRMKRMRDLPTITVHCPYCEFPMQFHQTPTLDWDCEGCHRRVYYENGQMVPVREITCPFCKAVHRVSLKTTTFTCDKCHRALRITDPNDPDSVVGDTSDDILQNYDVILTQVGRPKDRAALIMELEKLLICNYSDAKRRLEELPLTVVRNVAERKAAAIRQRLRDLGATAVIRPTASAEQRTGARRP